MTLEEAVAILNEHRHRFSNGKSGSLRKWTAVDGPYGRGWVAELGWVLREYLPLSDTWLNEFEAIAVAEKYQREAQQ